MNISPTMKMLGTGINDEFFNAYDTGILICYDEMYADKRDRHKEPYFRHLAEKMRIRVRKFNEFLERQKMQVAEAEKKLRKSLQRKKKKEKVEP